MQVTCATAWKPFPRDTARSQIQHSSLAVPSPVSTLDRAALATGPAELPLPRAPCNTRGTRGAHGAGCQAVRKNCQLACTLAFYQIAAEFLLGKRDKHKQGQELLCDHLLKASELAPKEG